MFVCIYIQKKIKHVIQIENIILYVENNSKRTFVIKHTDNYMNYS